MAKNGFWWNFFHEFDLFDFTSFFGLDFFNFLAYCGQNDLGRIVRWREFHFFRSVIVQNFSQGGAVGTSLSLDNKSSKTASIQRLFEVALVIKTKLVVPDCVQQHIAANDSDEWEVIRAHLNSKRCFVPN